ncbi:phospholipase A2 inhibitor and Ly6/PLAUR domain-containing protein-like [Rana temporaria]|uniref:phospholipase A2 inhibitor and Ly6/PLAUR domain-containing protein-like n=1 Tax=Rana temporaria TaxID=8407 RepID=UPI001AACA501|nr:phospholipase A2 inhibitor and Ly6/PLAUR domain-containing protein-like [Rana temporaria]
MKSVIFSVFLLFLFMLPIILAEKDICYTCDAVNSETCEHKEEECPEGSECMIISEEFISLGQTCRSISKRCALNLPCNRTFWGNVGLDVFVKVSQQCCKGPRCNPGFFQVPDIPTQAKGILCPSCYAFNTTEDCTATGSTICLGKDDQCIRFRGAMKLPCGGEVDFSAQGCSSKSFCDYGYSELIGLQITKKHESKCYVPEASPPSINLPK